MRKHLVLSAFSYFLLSLPGCATIADTYGTTQFDDVALVLSQSQLAAFTSLANKAEADRYIENFWRLQDSSYHLQPGASKAEFGRRLAYANEHFPDRRGWGRSDRKRIYLQYGPPQSVERGEFTDVHLGPFSTVKAVEIWLYFSPATNKSSPSAADNIYPGMKKFIFGDLTGFGIFKLLYSSEDAGQIDSRWFRFQ